MCQISSLGFFIYFGRGGTLTRGERVHLNEICMPISWLILLKLYIQGLTGPKQVCSAAKAFEYMEHVVSSLFHFLLQLKKVRKKGWKFRFDGVGPSCEAKVSVTLCALAVSPLFVCLRLRYASTLVSRHFSCWMPSCRLFFILYFKKKHSRALKHMKTVK